MHRIPALATASYTAAAKKYKSTFLCLYVSSKSMIIGGKLEEK